MPAIGTAFRLREEGSHIRVVISNVREGKVLVVNFTDANNRPIDHSCRVSIADYRSLTKPSAVNYKGAHEWEAVKIDRELSTAAMIVGLPAVPIATVTKIIAGAKVSDFFAPKFRKYLPA